MSDQIINKILKRKTEVQINKHKHELQALEKHKILNRNKIISKKATIQALEEAQRDIMTTDAANDLSAASSQAVDHNNYRTYTTQIININRMYNAKLNYGNELLSGIIDTRVAFIAGGGISVIAKKTATEKFINNLFKYNNFRSFRFFDFVTIGEMEGKTLMVLKANDKDGNIKAIPLSWYNRPYDVFVNDFEEVTRVVSSKKNIKNNSENLNADAGRPIASPEKFVYVKLAGSPDEFNETVPKTAKVLTQIENASRSRYDLRKNNHFFARLTPYFKTETIEQAKALNKLIEATNWTIGKAFAGNADFTLVGPPPGATEAIKEEIILDMKTISLATGIPVHWLAWPELMSNRATADNLMEVVNSATIRERETWQAALTEFVRKAMVIASERNYEGAVNDPDGFEIRLPFISTALLEQIQNVWIPLEQGEYITKDTVRNLIPGINPSYEKKALEKEKEERIKNAIDQPFNIENRMNDQEEENE